MTKSSQKPIANILIRNARIIDGTGRLPKTGQSILVLDGVISEIGTNIHVPSGIQELDATGQTVIPGLIDSHVHLSSVPGSIFRGDSQTARRRLQRLHLRSYLANGITTVLDTGIGLKDLNQVRSWLKSGEPGPRVFALGPPLSAPDGYADATPSSYSFHFNVPGPESAEPMIQQLVNSSVDGIKVNLEPGFGGAPLWPMHTAKVQTAIADSARRHSLPIYVHAFSEHTQAMALNMGARALVHAGFWSGTPSSKHVENIRKSGVFVMSTLSIVDSSRYAYNPDLLDAGNIRLSVPKEVLETARDPGAIRLMRRESLRWSGSAPVTDKQLENLLAKIPAGNKPPVLPVHAIRIFHEAGIPIVMGSDSGNWETIPFEFHGPTSVREIELLTKAGLTPSQALQSATRIAAEMIGVADKLGTIELGKIADLVIFDENPLVDLTALTRPIWVVKGGEARTPLGWMQN